MFLCSLQVWLQVTICTRTILQDFFLKAMRQSGLDLRFFPRFWQLSAGMRKGKANRHLYYLY